LEKGKQQVKYFRGRQRQRQFGKERFPGAGFPAEELLSPVRKGTGHRKEARLLRRFPGPPGPFGCPPAEITGFLPVQSGRHRFPAVEPFLFAQVAIVKGDPLFRVDG